MPYHDALDDALEFEVWVARGAKRGRLSLADLTECYGRLALALKLDTAPTNALGADSLTQALELLPAGIIDAKKLIIVAELAAFDTSATDPNAVFSAAWLDTQTLLLACPKGLGELHALMMALCTLAHESGKYQQLCAAALPPFAATNEPHAQLNLALMAGISLVAWQQADAAADGQLEALLQHRLAPELIVHPSVEPPHTAHLAHRTAQRILTAIAESGLGNRAVHLWVGSSIVTDVLSPYPRDLGPQLLAWAEATCGPDVAGDVYAAMAAFLGADARLLDEQHRAEQTLGLQRLQRDGVAFDVIDMARLDATLCDPELVHLQTAPHKAPIVLRLSAPRARTLAAVVERLIDLCNTQLASVTVVTEGIWPSAAAHPIARARVHLPWHAGAPASRPAPSEALYSELDLDPIDTFIDVPMPWDSCPQAVLARCLDENHGVSFAQMPLAYALARAFAVRAPQTPGPDVQWFVAAPQAQSPQAQARLACARLNALMQPAQKPAPPANPSAPTPKRSATRLRV